MGTADQNQKKNAGRESNLDTIKKRGNIAKILLKDDFEADSVTGLTPMNNNEMVALKALTLNQKIETITKFSKKILECISLKQLFNNIRIFLKDMFRCENSHIFMHDKKICEDFRNERGLTNIYRLDNGE